MIYTVRPVIAVTLLGVTLLTACDSGDPQRQDASPSSSSASVRWQRLAAECPVFAGDAATGLEPMDQAFRPHERDSLYAVGCKYRTVESRGSKVSLNVTVYRAPTGGQSPEQLAAGELERNRRDADLGQGEGATSEPVKGLGDGGFARLVPGRGVRLYVQTANAVVQLDYADPGDSRKALVKATDLTNQTLSVLR